MDAPRTTLIAIAAGALSLLVAALVAWVRVLRKDPGSAEMVRISDAVHEGAMAFLRREYSTLLVFIAILVVVLAVGISDPQIQGLGWKTAIAYLVGAVSSMICGFFGMKIATRANTRTAEAARHSFNAALSVAFPGGAVMGFTVAGLGLLALSLVFYFFSSLFGMTEAITIVAGFSMGASSIALFARVGGGIYTKAADVGADLVGKVEVGIPEDDPRNPATIADNVGDNVGDVAGMGADLFESYVGSVVSSLVIALAVFPKVAAAGLPSVSEAIGYVMALVAIGIGASLLAMFTVRTREGGNPQIALRMGTMSAAVLFAAGALIVTLLAFPNMGVRYFLAAFLGLVAGMIVGFVAEYYTSGRSIRAIAESSRTGAATNIISGFAIGLRSAVLPMIVIAIAILGSHALVGIFGIALAAVGMLAITAMTVSVDAYGPIADNAGGIAEMAHLGPEVRQRTDALDAAGNTTAAIAKGFAIASAALTALALFTAYMQAVGQARGSALTLDVVNPRVLVGLLIGGVVPFLFAADTTRAVGDAAFRVVEEVRRQFREIPGLMEGEAQPEYARCVDITTRGALKQMVLPGTLAVLIPLVVGIVLGPQTLGGLLIGSLITGVPMALMLANAGGAWDNAKKFIEAGNLGGKGSETHKAAVVGDTVGDPFKDTSGPSINILLKLMAIVSLVFTPLILRLHELVGPLLGL
ncbi:MAG: sodium-translocating pyrophosphatase [Candidatus Eisenbacteria sp.]|nr:sodium-translocating pyrophosphatase [Candidatus Eisenbacteria bacterium]